MTFFDDGDVVSVSVADLVDDDDDVVDVDAGVLFDDVVAGVSLMDVVVKGGC